MDFNAAVSSPAYEGPELKFKTSAENLTWKYSFFSSSQSQGFKDQALGNSPQLVGDTVATYCPSRPSQLLVNNSNITLRLTKGKLLYK